MLAETQKNNPSLEKFGISTENFSIANIYRKTNLSRFDFIDYIQQFTATDMATNRTRMKEEQSLCYGSQFSDGQRNISSVVFNVCSKMYEIRIYKIHNCRKSP